MLVVKKQNSVKIIQPSKKKVLAVFDQEQLPEYLKNQYTNFIPEKKNDRKPEKV